MNNNYRAWDVKEKRMYYSKAPFLFITSEGAFKLDPHLKEDRYFLVDKELVITQTTGMLDVNSKEIFDGDIVHFVDELDGETKLMGYVEWENCWWSVNLHPDFLRENDIMDTDIEYKVQGNIFENPDTIYWYKWQKKFITNATK
ncbi:YopX family protein [Rossellomorea marisflavi]|uniref:YopX family protein n=1 Tax=Rossellomorea marisflavi TaxID=189381 RepID=UPI003F9FACB1